MTDVSTAPSTPPGTWPAEPASDDDRAVGAPPPAAIAEPVETVLARIAPAGWRTLDNKIVPDQPRLVIDHLAIGPGGIFVIDSHSLTGSGPEVSVISDPELPGKLASAQAATDAIRALLPPLTRQCVVSVIAYTDASPMSLARGPVQICTASMLPRVLDARRQVLSESEVEEVSATLDAALKSAGSSRPPIAKSAPVSTADSVPDASAPRTRSGRSAETRRSRRFLGRRGTTAAPEETVPPVAVRATSGPTAPPPPYVAPPLVPELESAVLPGLGTESVAQAVPEPESVASPEATPVPEPEPAPEPPYDLAAIDPVPSGAHQAIETLASTESSSPADEPTEVVEPAAPVVEPAAPVVEDVEYVVHDDDAILTDYIRRLREDGDTKTAAVEVAEVEPAATHLAERAETGLGYDMDLGYGTPYVDKIADAPGWEAAPLDESASASDESLDYVADRRDDSEPAAADVVADELVEVSADGPDRPSWEELSLDDLRTGADGTDDSPHPAAGAITLPEGLAPATSVASPSPATEAPDLPRPVRPPGARRKAPGKPWHRLVSPKHSGVTSRRGGTGDAAAADRSHDAAFEAAPDVAAHSADSPEVTRIEPVEMATGDLASDVARQQPVAADSRNEAIAADAGRDNAPVEAADDLVAAVDSEFAVERDLAAADGEERQEEEPTTPWEPTHNDAPAPHKEPEQYAEPTTAGELETHEGPRSSEERTHRSGRHSIVEEIGPATIEPTVAEQPAVTSADDGPAEAVSVSGANESNAGLSVAVSRWKSARFSTGATATGIRGDVTEDAERPASDLAPRSRKQSVIAAPSGDLPEGLSSRGRKMYAAMNGGVDAALVKDADTGGKPRRKVVRTLLTLAVVAGLLAFSSLHYTEISGWVSDHVHIPSFGGPTDGPHKGGKDDSVKSKSDRTEDDKTDATKKPADNTSR